MLGLSVVAYLACLLGSPWLFGLAYNVAPYYPRVSSYVALYKLPAKLACTLHLSNQFLAGQVLMIGVHAADLQPEAALFKHYDVGGAVIMDSPANPYDGSIGLFKQAGASRGVPLLLATDEEGGNVQRFTSLGILPSAQAAARTLDTAQAQALVTQHGQELRHIGIDIVFGPLADVAPLSGDSPLGDRIFSSDPVVANAYDLAYVHGWEAAGILPTLKHFPGLGSATANTDYAPATTPPLSQLKLRDFIPYSPAMAATGTAVMVGNQVVPGWSGGPASLSKTVDTYLRQTLGFGTNLVVTDSLTAHAITSIASETGAAVRAIAAGNDILVYVLQDTSEQPNSALVSQLSAAINAGLATGHISKMQLATAVSAKLAAQHIDPCTLVR